MRQRVQTVKPPVSFARVNVAAFSPSLSDWAGVLPKYAACSAVRSGYAASVSGASTKLESEDPFFAVIGDQAAVVEPLEGLCLRSARGKAGKREQQDDCGDDKAHGGEACHGY